MGSQIMLVNVYEEETRIALIDSGLLVDLHFQQTNRERTVGNIYRGTIVKVNPAFQAAFVDYGEKRNGFLSISDINPAVFKGAEGRGRPRIQTLLRAGQQVMVQVLKEGMREKGAALTTNISLPGRYLVYTPNSDRSGVSRKIGEPSKRSQLKDILTGLVGEEGAGVIIRTAGIDRPAADLKRDLAALRKEWKLIQDRFTKLGRPGQVHQEPTSIVRVLRDYFSDSIEEVWVDSPEAYQESLAYFKSTLPRFQKRLKLYVGDISLFAAYNVEEQIEALGSSRVPLKSGGSVVIESTEALVSIDVNSGKSNQESDIEDTALRTNLEAAREVARQLRLRNLGGLIVVDFIDMFQAKNRQKVVLTLTQSLKDDKARTTIGSISHFGLLEMSRQRIDTELSMGLRTRCPACNGLGSVPTLQASANNVLRKIRSMAASGKYTEVHGELPMEYANYMLNHKRESLRDLELEFDIHIHLFGTPALHLGHTLELQGKAGAETEPQRAPQTRAPSAAPTLGAEEERPRKRRRRRGRGRGRDGEGAMESLSTEQAPEQEEERWDEAGDESGAEAYEAAEGDDTEEPEQLDEPDEDVDYVEVEDELASGGEEAPRPAWDGSARGAMDNQRGPQEYPPVAAQADPSNGDGDLLPGTVRFASQHLITQPDAKVILPTPRKHDNPFKAISTTAKPGATLFVSHHLGDPAPLEEVPIAGETDALAGDEEPGMEAGAREDAPSVKGPPRRRRRRAGSAGRARGRPKAKPEGAAGA